MSRERPVCRYRNQVLIALNLRAECFVGMAKGAQVPMINQHVLNRAGSGGGHVPLAAGPFYGLLAGER